MPTTDEQKETACWGRRMNKRDLLKEVLEVNQTAWLRLRKKVGGLQEMELQDHRGRGPMP